MNHNMMLIGVVFVKISRHSPLLGGVLALDFAPTADFFTQIPIQRQMMAESRDQFTVIQFPLYAGISAVQETLILCFLRLEMQVHAQLVGVLEDDLPLIQPRDVHPQSFIVCGVRENILIVADDIQSQERENVHSLRGQVVDGPDDAFALAPLPGRIAGLPVPDMRAPVFDEVVFVTVRLEITVEIFIG